MSTVTCYRLNDHLYQINETAGMTLNVDAYVVTGSKKAVVIDSLQETEKLYDLVTSVTDLPLILLLTHGHPDHAGKSVRTFVEHHVPVYMSHMDFNDLRLSHNEDLEDTIIDLHDGDSFDLGNIQLETIACAGHSKGSMVFLNRRDHELYSGDAIGSGCFWMQLPESLPLHEYLKNVEKLFFKVKNLDDLKIYPGHRYQSQEQLNLRYLNDNICLTQRLIVHQKKEFKDGRMHFLKQNIHYAIASYGMVKEYWYNPEKL